MTYRLFLDDERFPAGDESEWIIARTCADACRIVEEKGCPAFISFDHDLGDGPTGMDFARWFANYVLDNDICLTDFDYYVHSQNPVGRDNILSFIGGLIRVREEELRVHRAQERDD